jgi:hypothetical protein
MARSISLASRLLNALTSTRSIGATALCEKRTSASNCIWLENDQSERLSGLEIESATVLIH